MGANRFTQMLLVMALALRVLIPGGFMPVPAADGSITVAVCGSDQAMRIVIPGKRDDTPKPGREAAPCAFAGIDGGLPPFLSFALPTPTPSFVQAEGALIARLAAPIRALPPSTGPPLFV